MAAFAGVSYGDFLRMTPAKLKSVIIGSQKRADYEAWLNGLYVQAALTSVLSCIFSKRGGNTAEYPDCPYMQKKEEKVDVEAERMRTFQYLNRFSRTKL